MSNEMTSDELKEGCVVTLRVAHKLRDDLGRLPTCTEIQWRLATQFQACNPEGGRPMCRIEAMELAESMMEVVRAASEYNNTTPTGDSNGN